MAFIFKKRKFWGESLSQCNQIFYFSCLHSVSRLFQEAYPKCNMMIDIGKYQLFLRNNTEAKLNCALI